MIVRHSCLAILLACTPISVAAQGSAGTGGKLEPRYIVDMPTAGMLPKGSLGFDSFFLASGGLLVGISVGVLDRFSLGVSYGGNELIGSGTNDE